VDLDVIAYLTSKGLRGVASGDEVHYPCFFDCGESPGSAKRKLYVNKGTGMYQCFVCGAYGGTYKLQVHFGDDPKVDKETAVEFHPSRLEILQVAMHVAHEMCCNSELALEYLAGERRGLSAETIVTRKIGFVPDRWSLVGQLDQYKRADLELAGVMTKDGRDFFRDKIIIPYFQDGRVVQLRGKDINGRYYTPAGDRTHLYGADNVRGASDVVIVEGEFDSMILQQILSASLDPKLNTLRVCAVPGAGIWPDDADAILRDAKRVFIGFDPDETGSRGAEKVAEKLGNRGRILEWPESILERPLADGLPLSKIDWTTLISEYGFTESDFLNMLREASGRRLLTLAEAGARMRNRPASGGIKTGFAEFDAWIEPGLLPGQLMIPLAKTGTGKTILLCNIAFNNRHETVLFVTLEQTAEEVYERLVRIYRFYYPHATYPEIEAALSRIMICDENRLNERDLALLVDEYVYETGERPKLLLVDYLGYYARGVSGGSSYEKVSNAVMQLKAEAKKHRLVAIAPHQVNRSATDGRPIDADDARDSGVVEETADFLVALYRPDEALSLNGQPSGMLKLGVLKSRHGNKDRVATLQMGLLSLVMVDGHGRHAKAAREEAHMAASGHTYDSYLKEQTKPIQATFGAGVGERDV
jgi:5S rRNA maturation endonuclease (ribonuclease M5)